MKVLSSIMEVMEFLSSGWLALLLLSLAVPALSLLWIKQTN